MNKQKNISHIREIINTSLTEGLASNTFSCAGIGFSNGIDRIIADTGTPIPHSKKKTSFATLYDIASLQKPMVATVALKMLDQGVLDLDDSIGKKLSATGKGWELVQLRHLLTNSVKFKITERLELMIPDQMRKTIICADVARLGDGFYYHNSTSIILGWFLEEVLSNSIEQLLRSQVLIPAGMKNTFWYSEIPSQRTEDIVPSESCPNRGLLKGTPQDEITWMHAEYNQKIACAGLFSTASDLVRFGEYLIRHAFKNPSKLHSMMLTNYLAPFDATFGLGFDIPRSRYLDDRYAQNTLYHTGFSGGFIQIQPRFGLVMASLTNAKYPNRGNVRGPESPIYQWRQKLSHNVFG
jgi:CubicO group peptidase (beta-lactamase class C family)